MTWRLINTAFDRAKATRHRTAPKFDPEPYFNGRRLRRGEKMDIPDEVYQRCEKQLRDWERTGVIDLVKLTDSGEVEQAAETPPTPPVDPLAQPPVPDPVVPETPPADPEVAAWSAEEAAKRERASAPTMDEQPAVTPPPEEPSVESSETPPEEPPPSDGGHHHKKSKSKKLFGG